MGNDTYVLAMIVLAGFAVVGLLASLRLPATARQPGPVR